MNKQSFADLGVSPVVARTLTERGVREPFPVQASVIPDALAGHDVLVKSPTGSGKTLALGIPLVDLIEATDARAAALVLAGLDVVDAGRSRRLGDGAHEVGHPRGSSADTAATLGVRAAFGCT